MTITILQGDAKKQLETLPGNHIQSCVTSPPYFGLRNYACEGQIGLEETPEVYVQKLVEVFREVRRVMRDDGTLWLNLGDSYSGSMSSKGSVINKKSLSAGTWQDDGFREKPLGIIPGLKTKDMIGIPWRVAFALQADGWYLRSDIIWNKPNPMPESVTDRPTKSHEYIFLLTKSAKYFYDDNAIREPISESYANDKRPNGVLRQRLYPNSKYVSDPNAPKQFKQDQTGNPTYTGFNKRWFKSESRDQSRNCRTVWTITTQARPEAHFATFPDEIPRRCISAGSKPNDIVLDPFGGSGTTGDIARELNRDAILIELNPEYIKIMQKRLRLNEQLVV
jgi:DNA modification methylase